MTVLEQIYEALVAEGMSHTGALAMIGNMDGESCLYSNNLQDSYNRAFCLTDAEYTERVNAGRATTQTGKHFEDDGAGYGLCQWTYAPRKQGLYKVAREQWGVSIDDVTMQCWYACYELRTDYGGLWTYLCTDGIDLYNAVSRVCKEFERPALNNIDHRYKCAQRRAAELTELKNAKPAPNAPATVDNLTAVHDLITHAAALLSDAAKLCK